MTIVKNCQTSKTVSGDRGRPQYNISKESLEQTTVDMDY
jgi:hypothetical protein